MTKYDHPFNTNDPGVSPLGRHRAKFGQVDQLIEQLNLSAAATQPNAAPATPHEPERSQLMKAMLANAGGQASLAVTGGVAETTDRTAKRNRQTPSPPKSKNKKRRKV